jgi:hypothetical protein
MIRKRITTTTARPTDISGDAVADLKNITYRTFRKVLRRTPPTSPNGACPNISPTSMSRADDLRLALLLSSSQRSRPLIRLGGKASRSEIRLAGTRLCGPGCGPCEVGTEVGLDSVYLITRIWARSK